MAESRPFSELSDTGLLWLINRTVFHPRGFALALHEQDGEITGWSLLGDGTEAWSFPEDRDQEHFQRAQRTLEAELLATRSQHDTEHPADADAAFPRSNVTVRNGKEGGL